MAIITGLAREAQFARLKSEAASDSDRLKSQTRLCDFAEGESLAGRYHHPNRVARLGTPVRSRFSSNTAIAKGEKREYTPCPHLPPLSIKVSQVEMGRRFARVACPLFLSQHWVAGIGQFVRWRGRLPAIHECCLLLTAHCILLTGYEHRHHGLPNLRRQRHRRL